MINWDSLQNRYDDIWRTSWNQNINITDKSKNKFYYYSNGVKSLSNFFLNNKNSKEIDLESEYKIEFRIGKNNEYGIVSILDLISKSKQNNWQIYDFKSGNYSIRSSTKLQMAIYSLAIYKNKKIKSQVGLYWHFLNSNKIFHIIKSRKEILGFEKTLINKIKIIEDLKIKNFQFKEKSSILCNWCQFSTICPTGIKIKY